MTNVQPEVVKSFLFCASEVTVWFYGFCCCVNWKVCWCPNEILYIFLIKNKETNKPVCSEYLWQCLRTTCDHVLHGHMVKIWSKYVQIQNMLSLVDGWFVWPLANLFTSSRYTKISGHLMLKFTINAKYWANLDIDAAIIERIAHSP